MFEFTETEKSNAETAGLQNANLSPTNVASNNSIHQNEPIVNTSDEKSSDTAYMAADMMNLVDKALGSEVSGEKTGEKCSVIQKDGVYYTPIDEEIIKTHPTIIEELTVVERVGHQEAKTSSDSTSSAVSSKYIIAKFREFVNTSDKKSSDNEQYDLDPEAVEREAKRLTPKTDVKGREVDDEYYEAAVDQNVDSAEIKKMKKQYRDILGKMAELQIELRQVGCDMSAEQRLIKHRQKQIETQGQIIADLREQRLELEKAERENAIFYHKNEIYPLKTLSKCVKII